MYLNDYINSNKFDSSIPKLFIDGTTYKAYYEYWRERLFERVTRLFVWDGLGEIPQKEIELRLILAGRAAICHIPSEYNAPYIDTLSVMWCSMFGVTKYDNEFKFVNVRCPLWTGTKKIGKDVVIINNNSLREPLFEVVNHYAQLIAHNEVSIITTFINARDAGGVPTVSTEKQKQSMRSYFKNLYNGKFDTVTDIANLNVEYIGSDRRTLQNVKDLFETRSALIKAFYSEIGIRSAFEKNNNTVTLEVMSDTSQLKYNITDMLECRKKACEEINAMFDRNFSVEIAEEINYNEKEIIGNGENNNSSTSISGTGVN